MPHPASSSKGDEEIIIDPKSEDVFTEQFITSINKELRASGKAGDLKLSKERRESAPVASCLAAGLRQTVLLQPY